MPSFTFEGFAIGTPVDLSITQGGSTVSDNVSGWGEVTTGSATIGIAQTDTAITQFDSVQFTATGWADFDTPESHAASGNVFKPRFHDIVYFWDTGKTGDFSAPQNLISAHKSRRYAQGPVINVVFDEPGAYTVRLYAYEPSSGKWAVTMTTVTVTAADIAFAKTVCINRNGDTNFDGTPPGALLYNLPSDNTFDSNTSAWSSNVGGGNVQFLFKSGSEFTMDLGGVSRSDIPSEIRFGSYGTGRAEFTGGSGTVMSVGAGDYTSVKTIMLTDLLFNGTFNPSNSTGGPSRVIGTGGNARLIVHNVEVNGYGGTVFNLQGSTTAYTYHHFNEVVMTRLGGQYPIINNAFTHPESSFAMTGCRIERDPASDFNEGFSGLGGQQRAPIRHNQSAWFYMAATDLYQCTGDQPGLKLAQFGVGGGVHNLHSNTIETASSACIQYHKGDTGEVDNLICRGNILIAGHAEGGTNYPITCGGQGSSVDANLMLSVDTVGDIAAQTRAGIRFNPDGTSQQAPNTFRNNTVVNLKTTSTNINGNYGDFVNSGMDVTDGSNILHGPSLGDTSYVPLEDGPSGVALFTSRNTGRYLSGSQNGAYASDPSEIYAYQPEAGSPALGARTSEAYYPYPIDAQTETDIRPTGAEDFGCWQGAA